jgi:RNA polymerase sigma-70 factor (ECF subfamily)
MRPYADYDDAGLMAALEQEDDKALEEIYHRYWDRLYTMAYRRLRSAEDAEEIVQNVFLELWRKRDRREGIGNLPVYLAGMVRFMVYRQLDNRRRRAGLAGGWGAAHRSEAVAAVDIDNKQLLELLTELTNTLPEHHRIIFLHHKLMDRPLAEVAAELGVSPRTAERYVTQVMTFLRENRDRLGIILLLL